MSEVLRVEPGFKHDELRGNMTCPNKNNYQYVSSLIGFAAISAANPSG